MTKPIDEDNFCGKHRTKLSCVKKYAFYDDNTKRIIHGTLYYCDECDKEDDVLSESPSQFMADKKESLSETRARFKELYPVSARILGDKKRPNKNLGIEMDWIMFAAGAGHGKDAKFED